MLKLKIKVEGVQFLGKNRTKTYNNRAKPTTTNTQRPP
jgi:hypothetical protein